MSVGRRRLLLPLAFLGLAVVLTGAGVARAQQRNDPHKLWNPTLTPEQIKAALAKLAIGGDDEMDPLHKMLREHFAKERPEIPEALRNLAIKQALSDPKFMEKAKQFANEKQTDPGRPPQFSQNDLAKLAKIMPTDPGKQPDGKRPKPITPSIGEPPVTPKKETGEPVTPKVDVPPMADPGNPMNPPATFPPGNNNPERNPVAPMPPRSPDDALFKPPEEPTDPRSKSLQAFAAIWERNVGPLDQTPEVKKALFDLVSDANGLDLDLKDDKGNSIWDLLKNGDGSGLDFGNFMDGSGGNWKLPQFDFPSMKLGNWFGGSSGGGNSSSSSWKWGSSSSRPRAGSSSGGGSGSFGFGGSWFPVIVLGIVVLGMLVWVLIKNLRTATPELAYVPDGLGPWPIDPRRINTREDVVKAFEYLSILICGLPAKTWTHNTIADALADLAATHGETAVMLARLYELARYAPLDEPLTRDELMEARELVCGLAGVSY